MIFIDHSVIKQHYVPSDISYTDLYNKDGKISFCYPSQSDDNQIIVRVMNYEELIIGFNIKSTHVSYGYVCTNHMIISYFHISRGDNEYPHLIPLYGNTVELILNKHCITDVNMMSIRKSKYDFLGKHYFHHRIVKVNNFSPNVTYHFCNGMNNHQYRCTFDNHYNFYNIGNDYDVEIIDPVINFTKIKVISEKVMQLLNFDDKIMIKDMILCVGISMYYVV